MLYTVNSYLEESAKNYPLHPAIIDNEYSLTYEEVLIGARKIAHHLVSLGLFKKPIALMMDKNAFIVTVFFGIAMSGNYYTVIDSKMPTDRIKKILDTFKPCLIITDRHNEASVNDLTDIYNCGVSVCEVEHVLKSKLCDDDICSVVNAQKKIIDTDVLYVLFTSGSTGVPKGVIITHRSVIDYTEWVNETFRLDNTVRMGNQAPFYFDNSVLDIYSTFCCGGTLYIIPQSKFAFPIRLLEFVRDNSINTIFWVPTVLTRIADLGIIDKCEIDCLQRVLFAGEVMPARQLNVWRRRLPKAVFANLYGPTEITVDCTYYIVDREISDDEAVPIGYACANTDVIVLNDDDKLVSIEEKGELCVRGSSLSLGYYNNPEKTKEVFVQNPLNDLYDELIYRTGDIVHYNSRGEIIFDGRRDSQIKHTGHRIELGEIETAVSSNEFVKLNCCLHDSAKDHLVLFYEGTIAPDELRPYLSKLLPEYMLPNRSIQMSSMPLNMNGKIDRVKLSEMMV